MTEGLVWAPRTRNIQLGGINHLALVCSDMRRTVDFYSGVLGMPLIKTIDLPVDMGQHFFFDCGGGDCVAFFWFAGAPDARAGRRRASRAPGAGRPGQRGRLDEPCRLRTSPQEHFDEYYSGA